MIFSFFSFTGPLATTTPFLFTVNSGSNFTIGPPPIRDVGTYRSRADPTRDTQGFSTFAWTSTKLPSRQGKGSHSVTAEPAVMARRPAPRSARSARPSNRDTKRRTDLPSSAFAPPQAPPGLASCRPWRYADAVTYREAAGLRALDIRRRTWIAGATQGAPGWEQGWELHRPLLPWLIQAADRTPLRDRI
jgi:hypothetical protein